MNALADYAKPAIAGCALVLVGGFGWWCYTAGQADVQADWNAGRAPDR